MNKDDSFALKLFTFLASLRVQLAEFRRTLINSGLAKTVEYELGPRVYKDGLIVSAWVDAGINDAHSIVWWMDIELKDGGWAIDRRISESGQDTLVPYDCIESLSLDQLLAEAPKALQALLKVNHPEVVDLLRS